MVVGREEGRKRKGEFVGGHEAEGGFEAHDATPGGRDQDGAALVRAEGEVDDVASYLWREGGREGG